MRSAFLVSEDIPSDVINSQIALNDVAIYDHHSSHHNHHHHQHDNTNYVGLDMKSAIDFKTFVVFFFLVSDNGNCNLEPILCKSVL